MKREEILLNTSKAIIFGEDSKTVYLYVHGQGGSKEDAAFFAEIATKNNLQVLSIDLPGYGERKDEIADFDPWHVVPELRKVMEYINTRWEKVSLFGNSIGAWFSMLTYQDIHFEQCLFLSPILDMYRLIQNMIQWAHTTEEELKEKQVIETDFGHTLYWDYYQYAKNNPITRWDSATAILYGTADHLTEYDVVTQFTNRFNCELTTLKDSEHWFHTEEQIKALSDWIKNIVL